VIDALLAAGAALENGAGCSSALMVAVENGKLDVTQALLRAGASHATRPPCSLACAAY